MSVAWMAIQRTNRRTTGESANHRRLLSRPDRRKSRSGGVAGKFQIAWSVWSIPSVRSISCVWLNEMNQTDQIDGTDHFFSILLRRSVRLFGCDPIRRKRRGIDLLRRKVSMPNELPFEPLPRHPLISQLNPYLVLIPRYVLHPPLTQSGHSIAFAHGTHMPSHCLKNSGIALSLMGLHQREGLGGPTIGYRVERRRLHPEIVGRTQNEHSHDRVVNDLHNLEGRMWRADRGMIL